MQSTRVGSKLLATLRRHFGLFSRESRRKESIMEAILEELGLSTLLERFSDEKVDPHVVLAMSESALIRLGVATMGGQIRMKQLCKEAVDCSGITRNYRHSAPAN